VIWWIKEKAKMGFIADLAPKKVEISIW